MARPEAGVVHPTVTGRTHGTLGIESEGGAELRRVGGLSASGPAPRLPSFQWFGRYRGNSG